MDKFTKPIWQKNFSQIYKNSPIIALCGNVNDKYVSCDGNGYSYMLNWLYDFAMESGYDSIEFFSPAKDFFDIHSEEVKIVESGVERKRKRPIETLAGKINKEIFEKNAPSKIWVVEDASFLNGDRYHCTPEENDAWVKLRIAVHSCKNNSKIILLFNNTADVPGTLRASPDFLSQIVVTKPTLLERKEFVRFVLDYLSDNDVDSIANAADSLSIAKLEKVIKNVCKKARTPSKTDIIDEINLEITGYSENPWKTFNKDKVKSLELLLNKEIKGQKYAVHYTSKKVALACLGITDVVFGSHSPKGIMMLAGATGVGKTELVKQIAKILFGDENAMIRIDANEYQEKHTAQRLVGSPPGYVGHEAGGQLTNAVLEKPFSVILVDEVEKADPSFWDYFMTIIQDGRLTDGRGVLCNFSNTIIFFTTNLGAKEASVCESNEEASKIVIESIENYFSQINRKEIYGRIKGCIIPFNKIDDNVAREIVEKQLNKIASNSKEKEYFIKYSDEFVHYIMSKAGFGSEYGGRDVTNKVNTIIEDALGKIYLENEITPGCQIIIENVVENENGEIVDVNYRFIKGSPSLVSKNEYFVPSVDTVKKVYTNEIINSTDTVSSNSNWTYMPRHPRN